MTAEDVTLLSDAALKDAVTAADRAYKFAGNQLVKGRLSLLQAELVEEVYVREERAEETGELDPPSPAEGTTARTRVQS